MNGTAQVRTGVYTGLGFTREIPPEEPDYDVGKPVPTPVPLKMSVFPVPLEVMPIVTAPSTPAAATSPIADVSPVSEPKGQGELSVANYTGETLTFTIDNRVYSVAANGGELTMNLTPGDYSFSASTPWAGENHSLRLTAGIPIRVSVELDVLSGQMKISVE